MTNPSTVSYGNIVGEWVLTVTLSPATVAPNTTVEQTFTVQGLKAGDFIDITKPTVQAGLGIVNSRVTAANTLGIGFVNATAASILPTASEAYLINVARPDNLNATGAGALLTQIT